MQAGLIRSEALNERGDIEYGAAPDSFGLRLKLPVVAIAQK